MITIPVWAAIAAAVLSIPVICLAIYGCALIYSFHKMAKSGGPFGR